MNKLIFTTVVAIFACVAHAAEQDLKTYIAALRDHIGASNFGWKMKGGSNVCQAMKSVGLGCSWNERVALVDFLGKNGKVLFPCEGNTNPYFNTKKPAGDIGNCANIRDPENKDVYIGQPIQNQMLAAMITKNKHLFKNGNLTADNAKKWQM